MRLIVNGEPYVYTHHCMGNERKGETMAMERVQQLLVDALYESFCKCRSDIRKINDDSWRYRNSHKTGFFQRLFSSSKKQRPDLIYKMGGDSHETWLYVMPSRDDMSLIDMKYVANSVKNLGVLPVLIIGDLWCFDTNGERNICGGAYAAKFETISLLNEKNNPLPELLSQKQLAEKVALCWKNLDVDIIEPFLDKDFHYTSDAVFYEMSSRQEYTNYLRGKFDTLRRGTNPIGVQIGRMNGTNDFAVLLHQGAYNQSLLLTIQAKDGRITNMRMCEYEV